MFPKNAQKSVLNSVKIRENQLFLYYSLIKIQKTLVFLDEMDYNNPNDMRKAYCNKNNNERRKSMKIKSIAALAAATIMALSSVGMVYADTSVSTANQTIQKTATTVSVPISVTGATNVNAYAVKVSYDSNILTPVQHGTDILSEACYATPGSVLGENGVFVADNANSQVLIGWANADAKSISTDGTIATVDFTVNSTYVNANNPASTDIKVEVVGYAQNANSLDDTAVGGTGVITIGSTGLKGDANGDGVVSGNDAYIVSRHVAEIELITDSTNLSNADVDSNGSVTGNDAYIISRHVADVEKFS